MIVEKFHFLWYYTEDLKNTKICTDNLLEQLVNKCKASVSIDINEHKSYNISIAEHLNNLRLTNAFDDDDDDEKLYNEIIEKDKLYEVQFYPDTSNGFYIIYHWDLKTALIKALSTFEK